MPKRTSVLTKLVAANHRGEEHFDRFEATFRQANAKGKVLKIGLEMAIDHPDVPNTPIVKKTIEVLRKRGQLADTYFTKVAKLAQKYEHKVIWLEPPGALKLGHEKWDKELANEFKAHENDEHFIAKNSSYILQRATNPNFAETYANTRSRIMARNIRLHKPDFAIVGKDHVPYLQKRLGVQPIILSQPNQLAASMANLADTLLQHERNQARRERRETKRKVV